MQALCMLVLKKQFFLWSKIKLRRNEWIYSALYIYLWHVNFTAKNWVTDEIYVCLKVPMCLWVACYYDYGSVLSFILLYAWTNINWLWLILSIDCFNTLKNMLAHVFLYNVYEILEMQITELMINTELCWLNFHVNCERVKI